MRISDGCGQMVRCRRRLSTFSVWAYLSNSGISTPLLSPLSRQSPWRPCAARSSHSCLEENAPSMEEMNKFIEEKIPRMILEETILKIGQLAFSLYGDHTHLYFQPLGRCWLDWMKDRHRYVRRLGCADGVHIDRYELDVGAGTRASCSGRWV